MKPTVEMELLAVGSANAERGRMQYVALIYAGHKGEVTSFDTGD